MINFFAILNESYKSHALLALKALTDNKFLTYWNYKYNLKKSNEYKIPIIATNEVFYLDHSMHEAHDALTCIGTKTYINEKNRTKFTDHHYIKSDEEMRELYSDIQEDLLP